MDEERETPQEESDRRGRNFLIGFGLLAVLMALIYYSGPSTGYFVLDVVIVYGLLLGALGFVGRS